MVAVDVCSMSLVLNLLFTVYVLCAHAHTRTHTHTHTHKDDFKPLSVDQTKPGKLRVADDEVNVLLPLVQVCVKFYVCIVVGNQKPYLQAYRTRVIVRYG